MAVIMIQVSNEMAIAARPHSPIAANIFPRPFMNYVCGNRREFCKQLARWSTRFYEPNLGQYRCWIAKILLQQLQILCSSKNIVNNELMNYIKNWDSGAAPGLEGQRPRIEAWWVLTLESFYPIVMVVQAREPASLGTSREPARPYNWSVLQTLQNCK